MTRLQCLCLQGRKFKRRLRTLEQLSVSNLTLKTFKKRSKELKRGLLIKLLRKGLQLFQEIFFSGELRLA